MKNLFQEYVLHILLVGGLVQFSSNRTNAQQIDTNAENFEVLKAKAESGDAAAQDKLGDYLNYKALTRDKGAAFMWYCKAAEQGNAEGQRSVGFCYETGCGVAIDYEQAVKWYRKAAEQGLASGQFHLGDCYSNGKGVSINFSEAIKCYYAAANQGLYGAQVALYDCYHNGKGVHKDEVEASRWLNLAAAQEAKSEKELYRSVLGYTDTPDAQDQERMANRIKKQFETQNKSSSDNSTSSENPKASGSGFFITEDGYLITNEHVVKNAAQVRLVTSAGLISAKVVKVDAANDLALLKAEGKFSSLPIAPSRAVKFGGTVATVGFPNIGLQGFAPKFARGEIASLSGAGDDARYFQISVPVQPGNSGGALVDERGNVVGVVSAKLDAAAALSASGALPENVNYAVKSGYLLSFLESVPEVSTKLKEANGKEIKFEEVVEKAKQAAVLVLVY